MPHTSNRRPRQQNPQRSRRLKFTAVAGAMLLTATLVALALRTGGSESPSPAVKLQEEHDWALDALARGDLNVAPPEFSSDRLVYRYSVVPGGTHNPGELRDAIARDAVVAAHYSKLDQSKLRTEIVPADRLVHVSYRKGDQVFWTKKKLLLRKGETILTDGVTQIRARCGNCIAEQPAGLTSPEEPEVVEFDRLTEALPGTSAPAVADMRPGTRPNDPLVSRAGSSASTPLAGLRVGDANGPSLSAGTPGVGSSRSYDPLVAASMAGARETPPPGDDHPTPPGPDFDPPAPGFDPPGPGFDPPGPDFDPPWPDLPLPPGEDEPFPPLNPFPPGPDDPKGPENPGPPTPNDPPGRDPENPTPVPEPGTLLLVGGGAAELIRRMRRRRDDKRG